MALAAAEEAGEPDRGDGGDDGDAGESCVETVYPATGEVSITWPQWTQTTLPDFGMGAANDVEEGEQEPATVRGTAWDAAG